MTKSILAGVCSFLIIVGCFTIYNREAAMINNQAQLATILDQQEKRLALIEGFLNRQIQMSKSKAGVSGEQKA